MKNIHLIPTYKPSRLFYDISQDALVLASTSDVSKWFENQHIYITYEGDIKEGDIGISINNATYTHFDYLGKNYGKKIVLTTDLELITNGVQAIPDDFLEWFVKNSKCKFVKVERYGYMEQEPYEYKIIFPKDEPKMLECYFTPSYNTTSATICSNCGKEKMLHTIGDGIKVSKYFINPTEEIVNHISKFIVFTLEGENWNQHSIPLDSFEIADSFCQQFRDRKMSYLICQTLKQGYNGK